MNQHDLQFLISLIEDEMEDNHHPSVAATIDATRRQLRTQEPIDADLFKLLKNQHGRATGRIARVATKRLYEVASRTDTPLTTIIDDAAETYGCQPRELSDDRLCRYLNQQ